MSKIKFPKGWDNPQIVEVHQGTYTVAILLSQDAMQKWSEGDRIKLNKLSRKFIEQELGYKIQTLEKYSTPKK